MGSPACWAATVVWANPAQATQENPDPRVPSCVPVMARQVPPPAVPQDLASASPQGQAGC